MTDVLYDDGNVVLDATELTLRHYYFPTGGSKRIPYGQIRGIDVKPCTLRTGKGRIWGTAHPGKWFPLDTHRASRTTVVTIDLGTSVAPVFTPEDPDRFVELLRAHIA